MKYNCRSDDDGHGEIVSTDGVNEKMIAIVLCGVVVRDIYSCFSSVWVLLQLDSQLCVCSRCV